MRVGVLGGGQLGRMLALEGRPLGLRFTFLEPDDDPPVAELGGLIRAPYDDLSALARLASEVDVVTYEFENVPDASARFLEERVAVHPPARALDVTQDRLDEKRTFAELDVPTPAYRAVETREALDEAVADLGIPCVVKTRRFGYDGKGQAVVREPDDVEPAWERLGGSPLLVESFVDFERELSIVGARGRDGVTAFYPLVENGHERGILWSTTAPARESEALQPVAERYATALMERLHYVGVLALELFQLAGGTLLANEVAPRVHNSGHWTLDGADCSQFEAHLRAICGWPLATPVVRPSVMINVLGEAPAIEALLAVPGVRVHLYEKEPRGRRKVGHATLVGPHATAENVARLRALLRDG